MSGTCLVAHFGVDSPSVSVTPPAHCGPWEAVAWVPSPPLHLGRDGDVEEWSPGFPLMSLSPCFSFQAQPRSTRW